MQRVFSECCRVFKKVFKTCDVFEKYHNFIKKSFTNSIYIYIYVKNHLNPTKKEKNEEAQKRNKTKI